MLNLSEECTTVALCLCLCVFCVAYVLICPQGFFFSFFHINEKKRNFTEVSTALFEFLRMKAVTHHTHTPHTHTHLPPLFSL